MNQRPLAVAALSVVFCMTAPPAIGTQPDAVHAAVTHSGRAAADLERDPQRKPGAVLRFFGIQPGMRVLDVFSGGGYYTELASHLVGQDGQVVAHNNQAYVNYAADELKRRFQNGRLGNVTRITQEANELDLEADHFDAILMVLAYHDVYYTPGDGTWPTIDGPGFLARLLASLKSGGIVGIVDHAAVAGAPAEVGHSLHRIDPARLRREFEAAGFVLDGELEVLRNPEDDRTQPMYAEGIRGKTDRFVYRFRKP